MKIIQVIPVLDLAGAETMCQNLAIELHSIGHDVSVVSLYSKDTPITKNLEKHGIKVAFLNKKSGLDIGCIYRLVKLLKKKKPDVVHSHIYACKYAHIAASIAGVKCKIHTVHNIAEKEATPSNQRMYRLLFKRYQVVPVALSELVKESIHELYSIDLKHIPVVYNGIPLEKCKPVSKYRSNNLRFIHVGRFMEAKNHFAMIKAFVKAHEMYDDIKLLLYGEGELKKDVEDLVRRNNAQDYILFMGLTTNIYEVLNKADIFILPSLYEGMPMTLIEAMGSALPIITSPVGGIPDMLEKEKEALFVTPDEDGIYGGIIKMLANSEERKALAIAAKSRAVKFSAKYMTEKYVEIYKRVIKSEFLDGESVNE